MSLESASMEVVRSDPMEDNWECDLAERTPFDPMGSCRLDSSPCAFPELPF